MIEPIPKSRPQRSVPSTDATGIFTPNTDLPQAESALALNGQASGEEYGYVYCNSDISSCVRTNGTSTESLPTVIFCKKATDPPWCVFDEDIMKDMSAIVGYLSAIGPATELLINPVVAIICTKIGHRLPFMFGAALQVVGSLLFVVATNVGLLFAARVVCSMAAMTCSISGLTMASVIFTDEKERGKILTNVYASSFPLASIVTYLIGNVGYSFFGPRLPFGILLMMSILDGTLRIVMDSKYFESVEQDISKESEDHVATESGDHVATEDSPILQKRLKGTYKNYLSNAYMILTIILISTNRVAGMMVYSTSPSWVINVLHAKQWQLGVVYGAVW